MMMRDMGLTKMMLLIIHQLQRFRKIQATLIISHSCKENPERGGRSRTPNCFTRCLILLSPPLIICSINPFSQLESKIYQLWLLNLMNIQGKYYHVGSCQIHHDIYFQNIKLSVNVYNIDINGQTYTLKTAKKQMERIIRDGESNTFRC